ncbi:hypothetical protein NUACC21_22360 [Scytonema sp. NUACC21]
MVSRTYAGKEEDFHLKEMTNADSYQHFVNRESLLTALAEEGFQGLYCSLQEALQQAPNDPLKQLEAIGIAYVRYAISHPSHYRVMFGSYGINEKTQPSLKEASKQAFMVLVNVIVDGQSTGVMRSGEPKQLVLVSWSLVHGLAMLLIDGQMPVTESREIDALSGFITHVFVQAVSRS